MSIYRLVLLGFVLVSLAGCSNLAGKFSVACGAQTPSYWYQYELGADSVYPFDNNAKYSGYEYEDRPDPDLNRINLQAIELRFDEDELSCWHRFGDQVAAYYVGIRSVDWSGERGDAAPAVGSMLISAQGGSPTASNCLHGRVERISACYIRPFSDGLPAAHDWLSNRAQLSSAERDWHFAKALHGGYGEAWYEFTGIRPPEYLTKD